MKTLTDRTAVVTGAGSGIGRALALAFAGEGMNVVLSDVDETALASAVAEVQATGAEAIGVPCDVSNVTQLQGLADRTIERFGHVHVLCNNAGVESGTLFSDISQATWDWMIGVDFDSVINGTRIFLPLLRREEEGHIVNTGSIASIASEMTPATPYSFVKWSVLGFSETLFHELHGERSGVGVSALLPGMVATNMPDSERNRPAGVPSTADDPSRAALHDFTHGESAAHGMPAAEAAALVVQAIYDDRFYILTHPEMAIDAMNERLRWMAVGNEIAS